MGKRGRKPGPHWSHMKFFATPAFKELKAYLEDRIKLGYDVYPATGISNGKVHWDKILRVFKETPLNRVKIVIVGQDPYPQKGYADGLGFSVSPSVKKIPPSLNNIFLEYCADLGYKYPLTGDLSTWARNGVFLFTVVWTIDPSIKRSINRGGERHRTIGHYKINGNYYWDALNVEVFTQLSNKRDKLVFILWGKKAQAYRHLIDEKKHLVLIGAYPSPRNGTLTAKDGIKFRGGKYFSKACEYLDINPTIWRLP